MVKTAGAFLVCSTLLLSSGASDADEKAASPGVPAFPEASAPAEIPGDAEARRSFEEGLELLQAERWADAEGRFRHSLARKPRQSTRYNLALVLFQQRRYLESLTLLEELLATTDVPTDAEFRDYARALLPHVQANVSTVHLFIEPAVATLRVDGEPVTATGGKRAIRLNPGAHRLELEAPGFKGQSLELTTEPGAEQPRTVVLARVRPAPNSHSQAAPSADRPPPSTPSKLGPWLTIGAGAALVVSGVIVLVAAQQANDDFVEQCPTIRECDPELEGLQDKVGRLERISYVLLVSGGAVVVGGITWRVLTPSPAGNDGSAGEAFGISAHGRF